MQYPQRLTDIAPFRAGLTVAGLLLALVLAPLPAVADPVVKCLQRGLKAAGHNPRGIDGIIGPRTLAAAEAWKAATAADLPGPSTESAARWCATLLREAGDLPVAAPGSDRYCAWFEASADGVWLDDEGVALMSFRLAANPDGAGCYAWLNAAPAWQIAETGSVILRVERAEGLWSTGDARDGIVLDQATGLARYVLGGVTTFGVLLD